MTDVAHSSARGRSLRRDWNRAFLVMLVLMLVTGLGTIAGMWQLVGQFSHVASVRDRETGAVNALRGDLVNHEQTGHQILSGGMVDRPAFVREQNDIDQTFLRTAEIFPSSDGSRQILARVRADWEQGLRDAGLWGGQALAMTGVHLAENPVFGADSDASRGELDELEAPSLRAMHRGLAQGRVWERYVIVSLSVLFLLAFATTVYFRRKLSRHLLRPLAAVRYGATRLHAGDLDHRIPVTRRDELGDLAQVFNDMAEALRENHKTLVRRATCDALTGLANRAGLAEHLATAFDPSAGTGGSCASVLFVDVDNFKEINDAYGHETGDAVLLHIVDLLSRCVQDGDLVARIGGDEFAVVVAEHDGYTGTATAERILTAMAAPVVVNTVRLAASVSIGVADREAAIADPLELFRRADFAMYLAKSAGKGRSHTFDALAHYATVDPQPATVEPEPDRSVLTGAGEGSRPGADR